MQKSTSYFMALGLLFLSACTSITSSFSMPSSSETTSTSETESRSDESSEGSSSSSELSSSSSNNEPAYQELTISRSTWPLLTYSPFVPTRAFFNNVQFKYMGANNGVTDIIVADSSAFYMNNVTPLLNIERIILNKALVKSNLNFKVFGSNMVLDDSTVATPAAQEIVPTVIDSKTYSYDFSSYEFSYFRITNGISILAIRSIQVFISPSYEFPTSLQSENETIPDTGDGYYQLLEPSITRDDFKFMAGSTLDYASINHTGNPKVLVVPVEFTDYACGVVLNCATITERINKAFFGTSEDTPYESVRSYYYKSSYGKLTIDGTLTPVYQTNKTTTEWAREVRTGRDYDSFYHPAWGLTEDVTAWYKNLTNSNLSEYDGNGDGWIDAIYLLYLSPAYPRTTSYPSDIREYFWAYVFWNYNNLRFGNVDDPVPFSFSFLGYDFMNSGYGPSGIDAITYIHETGHILGLNDYYSYDKDSKAWGPSGALDMMDYNILDHNAYSKFLLEWINPYVIDNTKQVTTLTIEPFESSGDAIIVKNGFNDSPYDNYLILEYYTPTGLNEKHSQNLYSGNNLRGFTEPGVKIYHVDSRIAAYDYETGEFKEFRDDVIRPVDDVFTEYYLIVNSNSVTRHYGDMTYMKLLHLLEADGRNTFITGARASNNTLFQQGDSLTPVKHFTAMTLLGQFNDQNDIGYDISIGEMTPEGVTITFTRWSF